MAICICLCVSREVWIHVQNMGQWFSIRGGGRGHIESVTKIKRKKNKKIETEFLQSQQSYFFTDHAQTQ